MRLLSVAAAAMATVSAPALATLPPTVEQHVCSQGSMFFGKVFSARSLDCRRRTGDSCEPKFGAILKIQVIRVLLGSSSRTIAGQVLQAYTHVCSHGPIRVGNQWYDICSPEAEELVTVRRDDQPATDEDVARAFVGRSLWFGTWANGQGVNTWVRPEQALTMWRDVCPSSVYRRR